MHHNNIPAKYFMCLKLQNFSSALLPHRVIVYNY